MRYEKRFPVEGAEESLREGIRAFFVGEGYDADSDGSGEQTFVRRSSFWKSFSSKVEDLPSVVRVRTFPSPEGDDGRSGLHVRYDVRAGLRLLTRIDHLFFVLETDGLREYLDSGIRRDAAERLAPVRGPVRIALAMNFLISTLLLATLGVVAGFHLWITISVAAVVAFLNFVSILGFAELLVEGMERIQPRVG